MAKRKAARERQTSRKAGVTSTAQKMDSSRHGFDTEPAARKKAGAFGREEAKSARPRRPATAATAPGRAAALRGLKPSPARKKAR